MNNLVKPSEFFAFKLFPGLPKSALEVADAIGVRVCQTGDDEIVVHFPGDKPGTTDAMTTTSSECYALLLLVELAHERGYWEGHEVARDKWQ
jgi:hypothetical protein